MKVHRSPRCEGCSYSQGGHGNMFKCGLLLTKEGEPTQVFTPTTEFRLHENCAYRLWAQLLIGISLVELARQARPGWGERSLEVS